jgi:hypothetical protein
MSPGETSRVAKASSRAPSVKLVSMRVDRFHPTHLREYASRMVERRDKLARHSDIGEISHPNHIRSIRRSAIDQGGIDRIRMLRMPFELTQQRLFTHDPSHALMVDLPSSPLQRMGDPRLARA